MGAAQQSPPRPILRCRSDATRVDHRHRSGGRVIFGAPDRDTGSLVEFLLTRVNRAAPFWAWPPCLSGPARAAASRSTCQRSKPGAAKSSAANNVASAKRAGAIDFESGTAELARARPDNPAKSTLRGRLHRERQRDGYRIYATPMHEDGLTALIAAGFLSEGEDADDGKVGAAIGAFLASAFELAEPSDASFKRVRLDPRRAM